MRESKGTELHLLQAQGDNEIAIIVTMALSNQLGIIVTTGFGSLLHYTNYEYTSLEIHYLATYMYYTPPPPPPPPPVVSAYSDMATILSAPIKHMMSAYL